MRYLFAIILLLACARARCGEEVTFSLKECIDYALEHSPTLAKQRVTVRNQELQSVIEEARFAFMLTAGDTHYARGGTDDAFIRLTKEFSYGFSVASWVNAARENGKGVTTSYVALQVSKTILGGGSRLAASYSWKASLINELAELNTFTRLERKLAQDVRIAYYEVILAQQSLQVRLRALDNAKRTLKNTLEREKPLDILTAEVKVPEYELSVNTARRTISNGLDSLKELMGMPLETPFAIKGEYDYKVTERNLAEDLQFARANLETFLNNRLERKKLEWQTEIYDEQTLPTLSVSATHYKYFDGYINSRTEEQQFSVNLSWELGRKSDKARLAIYRNRLESNQHDYFILDQALTNSLTSYHRRLKESAAAVELQEKLCDVQKRKAELYQDKWENGEIDILEVVRTQSDLEDSYVSLINKKITYLELLANYEYTMGK